MLFASQELLARIGTELKDAQERLYSARRLSQEVSNGDAGWYAVDGIIRDLDRPINLAIEAHDRLAAIINGLAVEVKKLLLVAKQL